MKPQKSILKSTVRGCYDIQRLRIETGNRMIASFRTKLGIAPGEKEDVSDDEAKQILKRLRLTYDRITDGVQSISRRTKFKYDSVISDFTELSLFALYDDLEKKEKEAFKRLGIILDDVPIWNQFLEDVKGVGPAIAGIIISEIDIEKAKYVSSLWKLAGLDVASDGRGRTRQKDHLVDREYVSKDGEVKTKKSITFNPFLKTKLMGVLGPLFLKLKSPYADVYYNYRDRIDNSARHATWVLDPDSRRDEASNLLPPFISPDPVDKHLFELQMKISVTPRLYTVPKIRKGDKNILDVFLSKEKNSDAMGDAKPIASYRKNKSAGHRMMMARRYMIKMFLKDLYAAWREIEGLPVHEPYDKAKLGLDHNSRNKKGVL